jgi:hypothetical protein
MTSVQVNGIIQVFTVHLLQKRVISNSAVITQQDLPIFNIILSLHCFDDNAYCSYKQCMGNLFRHKTILGVVRRKRSFHINVKIFVTEEMLLKMVVSIPALYAEDPWFDSCQHTSYSY